MPALKHPKYGSLQFYPRKRAAKFLPRVNWAPVESSVKDQSLLGLIAYKVGMATAYVKDNTPKIQASGKQIAMPVTILEVPNMKIFSVRFYKNSNVVKEVIVSKDKELKRKLRLPKEVKSFESEIPKEYDDIRVILYSMPWLADSKKTPDLVEIAVKAQNKLEFVKSLLNKEISLSDFSKNNVFDIRGLTTGKGLVGPVRRFGISLRQHKSEKGVRRPGSLGPWHPARVMFVTPMAGQLGMFTRVHYNFKVLNTGKISEKDINPQHGFKHYGKIRTSYMIVKGSVQGTPKRQLILTQPFRLTKNVGKRQYEFVRLVEQK